VHGLPRVIAISAASHVALTPRSESHFLSGFCMYLLYRMWRIAVHNYFIAHAEFS
jgi:hypothetical protein